MMMGVVTVAVVVGVAVVVNDASSSSDTRVSTTVDTMMVSQR